MHTAGLVRQLVIAIHTAWPSDDDYEADPDYDEMGKYTYTPYKNPYTNHQAERALLFRNPDMIGNERDGKIVMLRKVPISRYF